LNRVFNEEALTRIRARMPSRARATADQRLILSLLHQIDAMEAEMAVLWLGVGHANAAMTMQHNEIKRLRATLKRVLHKSGTELKVS
jgi:hypothetical protein